MLWQSLLLLFLRDCDKTGSIQKAGRCKGMQSKKAPLGGVVHSTCTTINAHCASLTALPFPICMLHTQALMHRYTNIVWTLKVI